MQPIACLVTDRHRLGGLDERDRQSRLVAQVHRAARHGVHLVQVRERDLDDGALLALVRQCVAAVRDTRARVVVNERLDVALAAGAHGVHLRSTSMPAGRARTIVPPGWLIGRSVHEGDDMAAVASGADYLLFGTVFESASKPGRVPAGLDALTRVARATALPVLAIGGVTPARIPEIMTSGAAGYAGIGLWLVAGSR